MRSTIEGRAKAEDPTMSVSPELCGMAIYNLAEEYRERRLSCERKRSADLIATLLHPHDGSCYDEQSSSQNQSKLGD